MLSCLLLASKKIESTSILQCITIIMQLVGYWHGNKAISFKFTAARFANDYYWPLQCTQLSDKKINGWKLYSKDDVESFFRWSWSEWVSFNICPKRQKNVLIVNDLNAFSLFIFMALNVWYVVDVLQWFVGNVGNIYQWIYTYVKSLKWNDVAECRCAID